MWFAFTFDRNTDPAEISKNIIALKPEFALFYSLAYCVDQPANLKLNDNINRLVTVIKELLQLNGPRHHKLFLELRNSYQLFMEVLMDDDDRKIIEFHCPLEFSIFQHVVTTIILNLNTSANPAHNYILSFGENVPAPIVKHMHTVKKPFGSRPPSPPSPLSRHPDCLAPLLIPQLTREIIPPLVRSPPLGDPHYPFGIHRFNYVPLTQEQRDLQQALADSMQHR